nr:PREDICTED: uncharacterized protein LOC109035608 isoform X1 [Bemisia tabaci]
MIECSFHFIGLGHAAFVSHARDGQSHNLMSDESYGSSRYYKNVTFIMRESKYNLYFRFEDFRLVSSECASSFLTDYDNSSGVYLHDDKCAASFSLIRIIQISVFIYEKRTYSHRISSEFFTPGY